MTNTQANIVTNAQQELRDSDATRGLDVNQLGALDKCVKALIMQERCTLTFGAYKNDYKVSEINIEEQRIVLRDRRGGTRLTDFSELDG
ncbi:MAG: hypothetical protein COB09_18645 [Thalassobium sp.]|nr:MAG: hypothetical protein COB09_18645 [Thalassobium sp.]